MAKVVYPLGQVLEVKLRRVEEAERVLREKLEELKKEQEKLKEREAERDKVLNHYKDKLQQMRHQMDEETTSPKIQQMKAYLKIVKDKLVVEEKKVKEQQEKVKVAEKNVVDAREDLNRKQHEVDKLMTHRGEWEKALRKELELVDEREQDEIGNIIFSLQRLKKK